MEGSGGEYSHGQVFGSIAAIDSETTAGMENHFEPAIGVEIAADGHLTADNAGFMVSHIAIPVPPMRQQRKSIQNGRTIPARAMTINYARCYSRQTVWPWYLVSGECMADRDGSTETGIFPSPCGFRVPPNLPRPARLIFYGIRRSCRRRGCCCSLRR